MILYINTINKVELYLALKYYDVILEQKIKLEEKKSDELINEINDFLKLYNIKPEELKGIYVENKGGSFTSLRVGVACANALGYSLKIPVKEIQDGKTKLFKKGEMPIPKSHEKFKFINAVYNNEPNITQPKELAL